MRDDRELRFVKGHGTGNDFVVLPDPDGDLELTPELVRALCDRRTGIGADGVLRVVLAAAAPEAAAPAGAGTARWFMDYRNADGSIAEMCGNGARVFARYLVAAGYAQPGRFPIATRAGLRLVDVPAVGDVTVDMGVPRPGASAGAPVTVAGRSFTAAPVSMGNPHAVCFADDLDAAALARLDLTRPPTFSPVDFPDGVNVEIVVDRPGGVAMRVYERGVGETSSCGTGACAVAVAWARRQGLRPDAPLAAPRSGSAAVSGLGPVVAAAAAGSAVEVAVDVPGGGLVVIWRSDTVLLRGPAELVFDGVVRPAALAARGPRVPTDAAGVADAAEVLDAGVDVRF
ncbi:Diaminopimelate epimerase [Frankia canadensis]|uniref:Diaminopimelate epimerase n=1 Tax=Frankia canadensis TaxID=1836972 RepID=A0A2I2KTS3_9ACTN|nr:diaminopimelate epimerase [Frankia canadensis]SNQ49056.1 Diaminopimelate epimerase [Frankia canadensis]SOU56346.1 Diaminopimelate epimerase [Frankia canadensis]